MRGLLDSGDSLARPVALRLRLLRAGGCSRQKHALGNRSDQAQGLFVRHEGAVGVQLSLAMAIPRHALGLGDVTASGMAGFATGYFGLECYLWFWLCMGVLGVGWVPAYSVYSRVRSRGRTGDGVGRLRVPFVPVIATAAALAVMCCA